MKRLIFIVILFASLILPQQVDTTDFFPMQTGNMLLPQEVVQSIAQNYGHWAEADSMNLDRSDFASIVLPNGNVLATGGFSYNTNTISNSCEEYNYRTNTWSYVASMNIARGDHQLVLLDSNRVLAIGGYKLKSCEIYNIKENKWTITDSLSVLRYYGWTVTLLSKGDVIVVGGFAYSNDLKKQYFLNNVEIFDASLDRWRETDSLKIGRAYHTATLLNNGKLLVVGGKTNGAELNECELFDPTIEKWTLADSLNAARYNHSAILLSNGNVLACGGSNYTNISAPWLNSCEVYSPQGNNWTVVTPLYYARNSNSSIMLNSGNVLFTGGDKGNDTWELYDPVLFKNIYTSNFPVKQSLQRIEKLQNGDVISVGGITWRDSSLPVVSSTAMSELYSTVTGIEAKLKNNISAFELSQNYPNPFNPSTTISYKINQSGYVSILIYNALGKEVGRLVNSYMRPGKYIINFENADLSSGVYFYTLEINNIRITKKMILLR